LKQQEYLGIGYDHIVGNPNESLVEELKGLKPHEHLRQPSEVRKSEWDSAFGRAAFVHVAFAKYLCLAKVKCRDYLYNYEGSNNLTELFESSRQCVKQYSRGSVVICLNLPGTRYIDSGDAEWWCKDGRAVLCYTNVQQNGAGQWQFFTDENGSLTEDPLWISKHNLEMLEM